MILYDQKIYDLIMKLYSENATLIFKIFTSIGSTLVIITGIISILILFGKKEFKYMSIACSVGIIFVTILKNIIRRPRPSVFRLTYETGYSFPSSHTTMSTIFYGLLIYLIWKKVKNNKLKYFLTYIFILIIIGVGMSRIYLGVHYATDVTAGIIIGIIYDILFIKLLKEKA